MQGLVQLTWVFSRSFSVPCASFSMLDGPNSSKLNKFLHSEVNLLIQHIIVQEQDGQNNNNDRIPNTISTPHPFPVSQTLNNVNTFNSRISWGSSISSKMAVLQIYQLTAVDRWVTQKWNHIGEYLLYLISK